MTLLFTLSRLLRPMFFAAVLGTGFFPSYAAEPEWPEKVVRFEDVRALTDFSVKVPGNLVKGKVTAPTILRAHIDGSGKVVRVGLLESCGNADFDESAMHAMRDMRFRPYTFGGVPMDVTLVVPLHFPKSKTP